MYNMIVPEKAFPMNVFPAEQSPNEKEVPGMKLKHVPVLHAVAWPALLAVFALFLTGCRMTKGIASQEASVFTRLEHGEIGEDVRLRIGEEYVTRFEDDFTADSGQWKIGINYEDKLEIGLDERNGMRGMLIVNRHLPGASDDTFYALESQPFSVEPGGRFRLTLGACSDLNLDLTYYRNWGETRWNYIAWRDADGNSVGRIDFALGTEVNCATAGRTVITGEVPANAVKASIVLGTNSPDIVGGFILYTLVRFESTAGEQRLHPSCTALSRPLRLSQSGIFSWDADTPAGAAIAFRLFHCAERDGKPAGHWDGPVEVNSGDRIPWADGFLRYEATLTASPTGATPVLRRVTCGGIVDEQWRGADETAPAVRLFSPVRVADASSPVKLGIADDSAIAWETLKVTLDGKDITSEMQREACRLVYAPAGGLQPLAAEEARHGDPDFHVLEVTIQDEAGNTATQECYVHVTGRTSPHRITMRQDGTVMVGYRPFFPIGLFGVGKVAFNGKSFDNAFREMKEIGFNTAHTYSTNPYKPEDGGQYQTMQEFLAAAEHHDLKVFINAGVIAGAKGNLTNVLRQFSSPAILGWYIGDDTATFSNAGDLKRWHETLRRADPDHITVQADWISPNPEGYSNYFPFVHASDGFLPESYSFYNGKDPEDCAALIIKTMTAVKRDIQRSGRPVKTIWPILQNFKGGDWYRYPDYNELRAMSYEAIIHGANGITWFSYGGGSFQGATDTPESWENMRRVAGELSALQEVFLEPEKLPVEATVIEGPQTDKLGYPSVSVMARRHDGKLFLICANSANAEVVVTLPCPGMTRATVHFEDRDITPADGVLTDRFAHFAVHVYELVP